MKQNLHWSSYHAVGASILLGLVAMTQNVQGSVDVSPAPTLDAASAVSTTLSPSYIGMGIEPSNLFAFVGTSKPNVLTNNLLSNLASYTGVPPHIRVGGNTEDTAVYNSSYTDYYFGVTPNPTGVAGSDANYFGPNYFQAINNLPSKTPISLGIGLAYNGDDAVNMSVAIAQQAVDTLKNVNLVGLEIGNEPDLYIQIGFRPSSWSVTDYGNEWIERVQAIYNNVLKPANIGSAFFEAACTATTAAFPAYKISNLVNTGLATDNGAYLAGWNQHDYYYYVNVSSYTLTMSGLLQLSSTSGQFTAWSAQAAEAKVTGKPYYVREMGSVGPAGIEGISNTFANCIWTLNFFLFASTVGVDSVQMHMLQDSYGSPWQPIKDPGNSVTFVRPSYYAFAAMNQIIGAKCATSVAQNSLSNYPSSYGNRLAVYSIYDGTNLQSLVLLNTQILYSDNDGGSQNFVISLPNLIGQTFYLSVLSASGADATSNITWNNMEYEQSGDGSPTSLGGTVDSTTVSSDGTLTVSVRDSQIVVANLGSVLGSQNNVVDEKACAALAASSSEGGASSTNSGKGVAPTFKSTSGFGSSGLSLAAIIGIAAGGGVALLALIIFIICCCVKKKRTNKRLAAYDDKALLPPNKVRSYANVPQRDSIDSSGDHDIWMLPMGAKKNHFRYDTSGSSTPYKSTHSRGDSGSTTPYKGDQYGRGDASYDNSIYEAPLSPLNNNMSEFTPRSSDGHSYRGAVPVSASTGMDQRRSYQTLPIVPSKLAQTTSYPDVPPVNPRGRLSSQPSRTPGALVPGQQRETRERQLSTPTRTNNVPDQYQRSTGGDQYLMPKEAAAAYRRSPSLNSAQESSRHQSSNRNSYDQNRRSSRRGFEDYDAPPVPRLPAAAPNSQRPAREPQPTSRSAAYPSAHIAGPRQQAVPARVSYQQYNDDQYDYNQEAYQYPGYHAQ